MLQRLGTLLLAGLVVTSIARAQIVEWSSSMVEGGQEYLVSFALK